MPPSSLSGKGRGFRQFVSASLPCWEVGWEFVQNFDAHAREFSIFAKEKSRHGPYPQRFKIHKVAHQPIARLACQRDWQSKIQQPTVPTGPGKEQKPGHTGRTLTPSADVAAAPAPSPHAVGQAQAVGVDDTGQPIVFPFSLFHVAVVVVFVFVLGGRG